MEKINYESLLTRYVRFVEFELSKLDLTQEHVLDMGPFSEREMRRLRAMLA